MDKEKEIEALAVAAMDKCNGGCSDCSHLKLGMYGCTGHLYATRVYEAGYRKADEVRKETAKEILQRLFDIVREQAAHIMSTPVDWVSNVEYLAKEYGVEVK